MDLMLNVIFMLACYPILFIMYFMLRGANDRNGLCFGSKLSKELKQDSAIVEINQEYQKSFKTSMIILAILPFGMFLIPSFSIAMSIWMVWTCVVCFLPMVFFAKANTKVKELKQVRGWEQKSENTYIDLKQACLPHSVKFVSFLPEIILSFIPVGIAFVVLKGEEYFVFYVCLVMFAFCTLLFYWCAVWADRQRIMVISHDSDINMNFARAKRQAWKQFSKICSWSNTIFVWFMFLLMIRRDVATFGILTGSVIYCALICIAAFILMKKLIDINRTYEYKKTVQDAADDDKHWIWGFIYYNKNDKHFMVESRLGTGATMNMGTKVGFWSNVIAALTLLLIPGICAWMIMVEFTPIQTSIEDEKIVCELLSVEYEIPLEEIESYEVITELPELIKSNGTGMQNVYSGRFEVYREGMYEVFLNPQNEFFIIIKTAETQYIISGEDDLVTLEIIDILEANK